MHCDIFCLILLIFEPFDVTDRYMETVTIWRISYNTLQSNVGAVFRALSVVSQSASVSSIPRVMIA